MFKAWGRVWLACVCVLVASAAHAQNSAQNKALVLDFFRLMFQEHQVQEAMQRYVATPFVQHNPYLEAGAAPLADFLELYFSQHPQASAEIRRVVAEGNLVVVHSHAKESPEDRGQSVIDIFRVADGKIAEHWNVSQDIPENPANATGMF